MPGLLAFHAHPDDEVTSTGGVLAKYADAGEQVVVVTGTDGAEGEIHNYENPEDLRPRLPAIRAEEIAKALAVLGVHDHEFLGYRDSGMMGTDANEDERCFWQADFMEAVGRLVQVVRRYRPEVMIIYDPYGGYGHPDHIQVHRVGLAAFWSAADESRFPVEDGVGPWVPPKLYWSAWPRSRVERFAERRLEEGSINQAEYERMRRGGVPPEDLTAVVDIVPYIDRKFDAWKAHRTQIPADWWIYQVSEEDRPSAFGQETFQRIFSRVEVPYYESDLFTGLR